MLDAVGQAYGIRPSELMEFRHSGRALMFDIKVRGMAQKEIEILQKESETVTGGYMKKQAEWPEEVKEELRSQGINVR